MENKLMLFINTVKYLKPSQGLYRVMNRFKRKAYKHNLLTVNTPAEINTTSDIDLIIPILDFNPEFLSRFDLEEIINNEFKFINIKHKVSLNSAWNDQSLQHLWRYNLHYFEYLYKLGFHYLEEDNNYEYYKKYKDLIQNWITYNPFPSGDGWHPYTISLRLTNWISTYTIFRKELLNDLQFKKVFEDSLYKQYSYLQKSLEKDVLGNHYFENIKAIIIGSLFFEEENVKNKFIKELINQLDEQILEDGMHFELSPMYHKIVLEGLIKITYWLRKETVNIILIKKISKMIDVMYSMEKDFGKTPSFNDSTDGISKDYKVLLEVCERVFNIKPNLIETLEDSGYYILNGNRYKLIFDCGEISPTYLPAHGHCDALSYELSVDGVPIIVNSGTYQYETGKWRSFFRETKAHNTVTFGNREQSQCWGSFRVAKRISNVERSCLQFEGLNFISGSYKTYFGTEHRRFISRIDDNTILVLDKVDCNEEEIVRSYIHLVPDADVIVNDVLEIESDRSSMDIIPLFTKDVTLSEGWFSNEFNIKEKNSHIILTKEDHMNFFGYLICLNNTECKVETYNQEIKIKTDKNIRINLSALGELN